MCQSKVDANIKETRFLRRDSSDLFVFISSLDANKTKGLPTLPLQLDLDASLLPPSLALSLADMQLQEFRMDATSSIYDVALAELRRQNASTYLTPCLLVLLKIPFTLMS